MRMIIALVLGVIAVIAVVTVLSFATHLLFSPWVLLVAAVAAFAWFKIRGRRSAR